MLGKACPVAVAESNGIANRRRRGIRIGVGASRYVGLIHRPSPCPAIHGCGQVGQSVLQRCDRICVAIDCDADRGARGPSFSECKSCGSLERVVVPPINTVLAGYDWSVWRLKLHRRGPLPAAAAADSVLRRNANEVAGL